MQTAIGSVKRFLQVDSAKEFKEHVEAQIAKLQEELDKLTGKENQQERSQKGRSVSHLRAGHRYIDACRVVKGARPIHGHFLKEARETEEGLSFEDAAELAQEAEAKLAEVAKDEPEIQLTDQISDQEGIEGRLETTFATDPMKLIAEWKERARALESKAKTGDKEAAPVSKEDIDELELLAREVVWYREKLVKDCGYRKRDLEDDPDLSKLEGRLDRLSEFYLADRPEMQPAISLTQEEDALRAWQQELMAKLAKVTQSTAGLSPSGTKEAEKLMTEISEIKARQASEGLTDGEQDRSEEIWLRIVRLMELRQREFHDKKHDSRESKEHKELRDEIQQLHEKLQAHKTRLREELGLTSKEVKKDPTVNELDERFRTLCEMGGA
eukprot:CAMPEP_0206482502 /NCGR_PEP_ID=MMETSP0324_2-20121206/38912_1 /ASSEMBLY_ACC=CAM_ASM_000836 /TAXON_ID=2866 /ORGANISM="Crypthecodinium cohnii, Strain Seligo" /LENGTH=383 /DNA_ID=CAMNT_0053960461 /DNA_START=103 /DNA_END=1254 /DNA_ORIENTATION=+